MNQADFIRRLRQRHNQERFVPRTAEERDRVRAIYEKFVADHARTKAIGSRHLSPKRVDETDTAPTQGSST